MSNKKETNEINTVAELQVAIVEWAQENYPNQTEESRLLHMVSEVGELIDEPGDPLEMADVFLLLLDHAQNRGVDLFEAALAKLDILEDRARNGDRRGG